MSARTPSESTKAAIAAQIAERVAKIKAGTKMPKGKHMTLPTNLDNFIRAVAIYLTTSVGEKSIYLEMGKQDALAWANAYQACRCRGYATAEEAERAIRKLVEDHTEQLEDRIKILEGALALGAKDLANLPLQEVR